MQNSWLANKEFSHIWLYIQNVFFLGFNMLKDIDNKIPNLYICQSVSSNKVSSFYEPNKKYYKKEKNKNLRRKVEYIVGEYSLK